MCRAGVRARRHPTSCLASKDIKQNLRKLSREAEPETAAGGTEEGMALSPSLTSLNARCQMYILAQ